MGTTKFTSIHLYTRVERGSMRMKCLAQEHNTMSPAKAQNQTTHSRVECTNHELRPPHMWYVRYINIFIHSFSCFFNGIILNTVIDFKLPLLTYFVSHFKPTFWQLFQTLLLLEAEKNEARVMRAQALSGKVRGSITSSMNKTISSKSSDQKARKVWSCIFDEKYRKSFEFY